MWQVDHTQLDLLVLDGDTVRRPWLTVVLDDSSRAVPGYTVTLGLNTSLALRQAIWTKSDPTWPMWGLPDILYVDHRSDFTSPRHHRKLANRPYSRQHTPLVPTST